MLCAPLTRLALALPEDWATADVVAAERAQLDFVTLPASAPATSAESVLEATTRIGVLGWAATDAHPDRTGVINDTPPGQAEIAAAVPDSVPAAVSAVDRGADVVLAPADIGASGVQAIRAAAAGRTVRVFATIGLLLGQDADQVAARAEGLGADGLGAGGLRPVAVDGGELVAGVPGQVVAELGRRKAAAGLDGFWLHLADPAIDLPLLCTAVVPALRENDNFRRGYESRTLRGNLALPDRAVTGAAGPASPVAAPGAGRA